MRYPQIFATKAIERKFNEGVRQGIIWHIRKWKTAAYYNNFLIDYLKQIIKVHFIVEFRLGSG